MFVVLAVGCGGKSQVDGEHTAGAGGAANGGASNVAGASDAAGASSAPSTSCPAAPPAMGDRCAVPFGSHCSYPIDKCSSSSFECIQGYWLPVPRTDGAAYDCNSFQPPNAPKDGDPCDCLGNLDCHYNDCADRGQIHAICDNTTWHVKEAACTMQVCGPSGLKCKPGTVCVLQGGPIGQFECAKDPCSPSPLSCECAAQLCKVGQCTLDSGTVGCICPTC